MMIKLLTINLNFLDWIAHIWKGRIGDISYARFASDRSSPWHYSATSMFISVGRHTTRMRPRRSIGWIGNWWISVYIHMRLTLTRYQTKYLVQIDFCDEPQFFERQSFYFRDIRWSFQRRLCYMSRASLSSLLIFLEWKQKCDREGYFDRSSVN